MRVSKWSKFLTGVCDKAAFQGHDKMDAL